MSARREIALNELLPNFEISSLERPIDLPILFGRESVIIDYGSGMGFHALNLAQNCPNLGVLAIEVHTVGLLAIAESATELQLENIRTHHGDGLEIFKDWLKPETVMEIHVLFPDPWPKARHQKRRLISNFYLDLAYKLLEPGGRVILVTDDESYFESALQTFLDFEKFQITQNDWDIPLTNYHERAIRLGNKVSQLGAAKT